MRLSIAQMLLVAVAANEHATMSLLLAADHPRLDVEHPVGDDLQRELGRAIVLG